MFYTPICTIGVYGNLLHGNLLHTTVKMGFIRFKVLIFYQSYSPVSHYDSFRFNIGTTAMHRLNMSSLDEINEFRNTNVPIHEIVCVSPPSYYLYWFEKCYPNAPLNQDDGPFCIQLVN